MRRKKPVWRRFIFQSEIIGDNLRRLTTSSSPQSPWSVSLSQSSLPLSSPTVSSLPALSTMSLSPLMPCQRSKNICAPFQKIFVFMCVSEIVPSGDIWHHQSSWRLLHSHTTSDSNKSDLNFTIFWRSHFPECGCYQMSDDEKDYFIGRCQGDYWSHVSSRVLRSQFAHFVRLDSLNHGCDQWWPVLSSAPWFHPGHNISPGHWVLQGTASHQLLTSNLLENISPWSHPTWRTALRSDRHSAFKLFQSNGRLWWRVMCMRHCIVLLSPLLLTMAGSHRLRDNFTRFYPSVIEYSNDPLAAPQQPAKMDFWCWSNNWLLDWPRKLGQKEENQ